MDKMQRRNPKSFSIFKKKFFSMFRNSCPARNFLAPNCHEGGVQHQLSVQRVGVGYAENKHLWPW